MIYIEIYMTIAAAVYIALNVIAITFGEWPTVEDGLIWFPIVALVWPGTIIALIWVLVTMENGR